MVGWCPLRNGCPWIASALQTYPHPRHSTVFTPAANQIGTFYPGGRDQTNEVTIPVCPYMESSCRCCLPVPCPWRGCTSLTWLNCSIFTAHDKINNYFGVRLLNGMAQYLIPSSHFPICNMVHELPISYNFFSRLVPLPILPLVFWTVWASVEAW